MSISVRLKNQPDAALPWQVEDSAPALPGYPLHRNVWTRIFSTVALFGMLTVLGNGAMSIYHAFRDAFVAPIILSPDSDAVIENKLNLSRLVAERQSLIARIDESKGAVAADEQATERLSVLQQILERSLDWTTKVTGRQAAFGKADLTALERQERSLRTMITHQEMVVATLKKNLADGLIRKSDLEREENALNQLQIGLIQNGRDQSNANLQLGTASLAKKALSGTSSARGPMTPEMTSQQEQAVRVELDLLKHESDKRAKIAQARADGEALAKLDELISQMKERPIFRAITTKQNVAFVPYTQIKHVAAGAWVYNCEWWGLFACGYVGKVAELLPGEVVTQDPWGTVTRGQYAILALSNPAAAQSKSLRIRPPSTWSPALAQRLNQLWKSRRRS